MKGVSCLPAITPAQWLTLGIFLICCILLVIRKGHPVYVAWSGVAVLLLLRVITPEQAIRSLSFNAIGIIIGMMVLSELFIASEAPAFLAQRLMSRSRTVAGAVLSVCFLSGFISAFVENVATVLIVAPVALEVARRLDISPIPFLVGIAISANLQGTATMIGDSPSIILAMSSGMNFMDFFWMKGRPGIFFAVELGALTSGLVLYLVFKKYGQPPAGIRQTEVRTWVPTYLLIALIVTLAVSSFFVNKPPYTVGAICLAFAAPALVWYRFHRKDVKFPRFLARLDWNTLLLLMGLFILIGSFSVVGLVDVIARAILNVTGNNVFLAFSAIVWISVLVSGFVDNIPYTLAMIPVAQKVAANLGMEPWALLFGLLVGASVGGNITPIGASANVVAMGILRKNGYKPTFWQFVSIGLPFTLVAVGTAYAFLWLVWGRI